MKYADQDFVGQGRATLFQGPVEIGPEDEPVPGYCAQTFTPEVAGPVGGPK